MAWDEIKFKISADMDFGSAEQQIQNILSGINGMKETISDMPNVSNILNNSLEKTGSVVTSLGQKLGRLQRGGFKTEDERSSLIQDINNDIAEVNTMRSLQNSEGSFGISYARSWFGDLPSAVQKELDMVLPKVANIIRTKTSTLIGNEARYTNKSAGGIALEAWKDAEIQAVVSQMRNEAAKSQLRQNLSSIVPHVIAANRLDEYQIKRYGSLLQDERAALSKGDILSLFPKSYRQAYINKGYARKVLSDAESKEVMSKDALAEFNKMLESKPIMAKAAIASGIGRRDSRGVLETKREITRADWENYRSALYDELVTRVAGYGKRKIDPYSSLPEDVKILEGRLTQSTSGATMNSMHDIEKYEAAGQWSASKGNKGYTKIRNEGRRAADEYVVTKYSPFMKRADGTEVAAKDVMISESHNTRLLGQGKWKNNDDVSGTIALISLAGYNPDDKEQEKQLLDLYRNGKVIKGKQFIAQSTHGKGDDQVIRMIEKSAYDRVEAEERAWAEANGIKGSYWHGFEDQEINRKVGLIGQKDANGKDLGITAKDWGKHLEMQNKAWTPTTDVGLDLSNRRIAVVDFQGKGDGATWAAKSMMPDSGQIRMGVGGKGSVFVFDDEVLDENDRVVKSGLAGFGAKTGIADAQGRVMMRGPDGKMFDVSGYDMVVPLDAIKNLGAYKDENGNFVSGEKASDIATNFARRYGIGMLANYTKEDTSSNHIGSQMASFIDLSPELREKQVEMGMRRMAELDTEAGQLKYVFGDKNDWLSRKVHEDPQLLRTEAAMRRIDNHRQSLMQEIIGGEFNFLGEGDAGIADMRLAASPLTSYLLAEGKLPQSVIDKARGYLDEDAAKKKRLNPNYVAPQYTDKEIANMIIPDENTVLDFAHKDQSTVAVIRSPTGYGNMVHANNIAAAAEPIYRGFGIATDAGIYVSDKHLPVLQGADYDSDEAKVIYNEELRKSVEESLKTQEFAKPEIESSSIAYTPEQLADMTTQEVLRAGRATQMNAGMGTGSAGIRIRQLDLSKPSNKMFIQQAQRLAAYYDNRTVFDKNAEDMDLSAVDAWPTLRLGKEYTKFSDKVSDLFAFEDDLLDENGNADTGNNKDVFKASNGKIVNLRRLRSMGVDNINLPAAFMANHLAGVMTQGELFRAGQVDTSYMDAVAEAMDEMGYGDAGPARQKLMKTMRHMLPQFGTGERAMLTPAETRAMTAMIDAAQVELREDSKQYLNPTTGKYEYKGKDGKIIPYKTLDALVSAREKEYAINTARNAVNAFGLTKDRLRAVVGDENYEKHFKNAALSDIELLPEDKEAFVFAERAESLDTQINEARAEVAKEKKGKKGKKGKRAKQQKQLSDELKQRLADFGLNENDNIEDALLAQEQAIENAELSYRATLKTLEKAQKDGGITATRTVIDKNGEHKVTETIPVEKFQEQADRAKEAVEAEKSKLESLTQLKKDIRAEKGYSPASIEKEMLDAEVRNLRSTLGLKGKYNINEEIKKQQETIDQYDKDMAARSKLREEQGLSGELSDDEKKMGESYKARLTGLQKLKTLQDEQTRLDNMSPAESRLNDLEQQKAKLDEERALNQKAIEMRTTYQQLLSDANEYNNQLWGFQKGKENKILDSKSYAEKYWGRNYYQSLEQMKPLDEFEKQIDNSELQQETKDEMKSGLAEVRSRINENINKDLTNKSILYAKSLSEDIEKELDKQQNAPSAQKQKMDNFDKGISDAKSFVSFLNKQMTSDKFNPAYQKMYEDAIAQTQEYITSAEAAKAQLAQEYTNKNEEQGRANLEKLQISQGFKNKNSLKVKSETRKREIQNLRDVISKEHKEGYYSQAEFDNINGQLDKLEAKANPAMIALQQGAKSVQAELRSTSAMMVNMFTRRLFQSAIAEVKRFVKEFDQSMTTIQMITLKSNEEMSKLGEGLIDKAQELKISISEISQSAATLYRQGLTDEEVNERLDVISKFSKVSGTKVDAATKLITVAMNTGLVSDPQVAADIVTALGDNAATNAAEIEKGIEKAGAAAAADKTSFAELASMLTAITSTTQIGGNVAGRTLNTIFGRMNKIGTNEIIVDENGNKISGSAVAKLLKAQGVETYDAQGKKRSSYDALYDLSRKWDKMSDAEQQQIATAIAGTRQYSNFAAIMQGMSEGKVDEYMALTGKSTGIVDEKYEIYTKSLQASLTDLKNAFDELINDLTDSGALTGLIDTFTSIIKGVDNLTKSFGNLGAVLTTVLPMLLGLTMLKAGISTANIGLVAGGVALAAIGGSIASSAGNTKKASEVLAKNSEEYNTSYQERHSDLDKLHELKLKSNKTDEENAEYLSLSKKLSVQFGLIDSSAASTITSIEGLTAAIQQMGSTSADTETAIKKAAEERDKAVWAQNFSENLEGFPDAFNEDIKDIKENNTAVYNPSNETLSSFDLWSFDKDSNKWILNEDAAKKQAEMARKTSQHDWLGGLFGFVVKANNAIFGTNDMDKSWNQDVEPYLPNLYRAAASKGYIRNPDGTLLNEDETKREYWSERLKSGKVTEAEMQGMLDYYNQFVNETGFTPVDTETDQVKQKLKTRLVDNFALGQVMSDAQIDALAELGAKYHLSDNNPDRDPFATMNYLFGNGLTQDEIISHANNLLTENHYQEKSTVQANKYALEPLGKYEYYVDKDGKIYTEEEANAYYDELNKTNRDRAIGIMQAHNKTVIDEFETNKAEVEAENKAREDAVKERNLKKAEEMERLALEDQAAIEEEYRQGVLDEAQRLYYTNNEWNSSDTTKAAEAYYKDKWIELHGGKESNWNYMKPERWLDELAYMQAGGYGITPFNLAPSDIQQKYIAENQTWDELTEDEQEYWKSLASDNVTRREAIDTTWEPEKAKLLDVPTLDESKLVGGVNATAESLGKLYDENAEILDDVKTEIDNANEEAQKSSKTIEKKVHNFVKSLDVYGTGDKGYKTKNQAGISADNITSLLLTGQFGTGAEGLLNFMNYVEANSNVETDWTNAINNNLELQRVMHQASYNEKTRQWTAPEDIMTQMLYAAQSGSLTYGSSTLTTQQKASIAQQAYTGLTENGWFVSQEAKENAQETAWIQYQEDVLKKYNKSIAEIDTNKNMTPEQKEAAKAAITSGYNPAMTQEAFLARNASLNTSAMSPYQQQYLKEALGDQLYARVLEANAGGKALTDEENALALLQLQNRSNGLTSLTARQQVSWLEQNKARFGTLGQEGGLSRAVADTYMSQWSNWNEYAALIEKRNKEGLSAEEQKQLETYEQSLANFEQQSRIKIDVEGIQALEDAGKVAEGTASKLEKLQKGGHVSIEVEMSLQTEAFEQAQQNAKLINGSTTEQDEAAMSILNMSREQYYAHRDENYLLAQNVQSARNTLNGNTWTELYNAEGLTDEQRAAIDAAAKAAGYTGATNVYYDSTGRHTSRNYEYTNNGEVQHIGNYVGAEQQRTEAELAAARMSIVNGDLTAESDYELYKAAVSGLGKYSQQVQWARENGTYGTLSAETKRLAELEAQQAIKDANEAEALEQARLGAATTSGALAYQRLSYEQHNKGALAADAVFASLAQIDPNSSEAFSKLINSVDSEQADNWTELIKSSPDFYNKLKDLGAIGENGELDFSALRDSTGGLTSAFYTLMQSVAGVSSEFDKATYNTRSDIYNNAKDYFENPNVEDNYNAYAEIVGSDMAARKAAMLANPENPDYSLNALEEMYSNTLMNNYGSGIIGLTKAQQVAGADILFQAAKNGTFNTEYADASQDMINAYTEGTPILREYFEAIKAGSLDVDELAEMEKNAQAELAGLNAEAKGYGKSAEMAKEFATAIAKGGTAADKAKISLDAQMKSIQDQQTALEKAAGKSGKQLKSAAKKGDKTLDIFSSMFDYSADQIAEMSTEQIQDLIDKAGPMIAEQFDDIVDGLFQALPDNVDVTLPISDLITVNTDGSVDLSALEGVLGETAANIIAEIMSLAQQYGAIDLQAELDKGTLTIEGLYRAIAAAGVKGGKGYSTGKGGGGGGGGKSATDELLEKQKQKIAELEHNSKMLEIQEKTLDFVNDYSGHTDNIDAQIAAQESLRAAYASNLSELKAQLSAVEEGSDDYNKLADAIRSAEESMASITNTINELNSKKIQILQTQQENQDKPSNQKMALLDKYAARYQKSGQFEAYTKVMQARISEARNQINVNNVQIAEWESLLNEYYEGSDSWIEVRDKIWSLQLENAELENQAASDLVDLEEARVAQIADDLAAAKMSYEHINNMMDTFGGMYQSTRQYEHYRETLSTSNENLTTMKDLTDKAIEEVKKQVESMATTDPARRTALQTLYELEETSAKYEAQILSNRQAIEESIINELKENHADAGSILEHELKLLTEQEKEFTRNNDFVNYENILAEKSRNASDRVAELTLALEDYTELQNSGQITEGSQQWRDLEETIRTTKEEIAAAKNEAQEFADALQAAQFETLKRYYQEGIEGLYEGMDQLTHEQNLIQYQETRYQNRGELTNYGTALTWENENLQEQRKALLRQIDAVKTLQETHKDNPQLYAQETEAIRKYEEELAKTENAIEKNVEAQKKNKDAILATQSVVLSTADKAIRENIQKQRTMLSATVNVESSILETIRKRFTEEWNLEKQTIEKKKQALNEEKNLINERVNYRKKMMDQETRDEELAEYKRQLALISADTTRTKEANELRRKINDMEKQQAQQAAEDIAAAEIKSIENRQQALTDYEAVREEDLNNYLSDARNFREELDTLINGSFEDFVAWNAKYNETYIKATDEQRKQMEQGWEDTWDNMLGLLKLYWEEADEASRSKEGWMALATSTDSFKSLSEPEQARQLQVLSDQYDAMLKAQIDNATFDDTHEILNTIQELKDWTFNVNVMGLEDYLVNSQYSTYDWRRNTADGPLPTVNEYEGWGKVYVPEPVQSAPSSGSSDSGSGKPSGGGQKYGYKFVDGNTGKVYDSGKIYASTSKALTAGEAMKKLVMQDYMDVNQYQKLANIKKVNTYLRGGLVDYTGPAWVDGTKTEPESFLDATDTELLRSMLDAFNYVRVNPYMSHIDDKHYQGTNISVGDINVNLYEAQLKDDADYDEVARKVGVSFTKDLQKNGLNLAGYAW